MVLKRIFEIFTYASFSTFSVDGLVCQLGPISRIKCNQKLNETAPKQRPYHLLFGVQRGFRQTQALEKCLCLPKPRPS